MLGAVAEVAHGLAAIIRFLGFDEAERLREERFRRADILAEQRYRPDPRHLERARQHDAADIVFGLTRVGDALARENIDAARHRVGDFLLLRDLRQRRLFVETPVVHGARLGAAVPADLLHAVIELDRVAVRIAEIAMPVAARHVAAGAAHLDVAGAEIIVGLDHFLERADLPGDLVQRDVAVGAAVAEERAHRLVGEQESVMIGAVGEEEDARLFHLLRRLAHELERADIDLVGQAEAEQPRVEIDAGVEIADIETEMAEASDLERLRIDHAADIVAAAGRAHGFVLLGGYYTNRQSTVMPRLGRVATNFHHQDTKAPRNTQHRHGRA